MDSKYGRTEFADYTPAQLAAILAAGRPGEVRAAAERWRDVANWLDDAAFALDRRHASFQDYWEGPAALAHAEMVTALTEGVRQAAFTARRLSDQILTAVEALERAQRRMARLGAGVVGADPVVGANPVVGADPAVTANPLPPVVAAMAARFPRFGPGLFGSPGVAGLAAGPADIVAAPAEIMAELRDAYLNIELSRVPVVADPPTIGPDGTPTLAVAAGGTALLSDFWRDGMAATAGMPVPGLLPMPGAPFPSSLPPASPDAPAPGPAAPGTATPGPPASAAPARLELPSGGAPGAGAAVGVDGAVGADEPPRAVGHSSLAPKVAPAAAGLAAAGLGAGAAGAAAGMMPMMPMMPFMGGAGMDGRSGDRSAQGWLIGKIEEFGVQLEIVPPRIG